MESLKVGGLGVNRNDFVAAGLQLPEKQIPELPARPRDARESQTPLRDEIPYELRAHDRFTAHGATPQPPAGRTVLIARYSTRRSCAASASAARRPPPASPSDFRST